MFIFSHLFNCEQVVYSEQVVYVHRVFIFFSSIFLSSGSICRGGDISLLLHKSLTYEMEDKEDVKDLGAKEKKKKDAEDCSGLSK